MYLVRERERERERERVSEWWRGNNTDKGKSMVWGTGHVGGVKVYF